MSVAEKKHKSERERLVQLVQADDQSEHKSKAKEMSSEDRDARLFQLKVQHELFESQILYII